ncbi:hypothetical protein C8N40_109136 [Pontibacter mucosus]|uniref:Uncharacterized protein n=1 Tax=Pontibacter mucosus TaxID=1649266 RepID=A0A2T5YE92_9BACT|nr:hypothetical protein [Pontibacter mucosus]PTX15038.1 hypothetical protein C8N40_109136 [Pontibacter mucosus]
MTVKRHPRKLAVLKATAGSSSIYLHREAGAAAVNSGCMRGNDSYGKNGSASVGLIPYPQEKPVREQSYSDFINFNYGPQSQRHYGHTEER